MKEKREYRIVVMMKQVIDTRRTAGTKETERSKLPAIVNPDDLKALEQALKIKDLFPGTYITVVSMGPARAEEILREALGRGADEGVLLCDKRFIGSDTLATSYTLSLAIKKTGNVDLILAGRQTIDGDTAHVGPQVSQILNIPQITCVELLKVDENSIFARRRLSGGFEEVTSSLPVLVTTHEQSACCRPINIRRLINTRHDDIKIWSAEHLDGDLSSFGQEGSPTIVISSTDIETDKKESAIYKDSNQEIYSLLETLFIGNLIDKRPEL